MTFAPTPFVFEDTKPALGHAELSDNLRQVWITLGRQPRKRDMRRPISRYSHHPYVHRFGTWLHAMRCFCAAEDGQLLLPENNPGMLLVVEPRGPREPSLRLRFLVMRRDNFKCTQCGRAPATHSSVVLQVDHILAWSKGGKTESSNLQTLCTDCNHGKGASCTRPADKYREALRT